MGFFGGKFLIHQIIWGKNKFFSDPKNSSAALSLSRKCPRERKREEGETGSGGQGKEIKAWVFLFFFLNFPS